MKRLLLRILLSGCMTTAWPAHAEVTGIVVDVPEGDLVTVRAAGRSLRLGVARVEAPHIEQPYGEEARRSLAALCHGKRVAIDQLVLGRKRRIVARVRCSGVDVGAEQVRRGLAWVLEREPESHAALRALQNEAREAHRGLWSEAQPVPPWMWTQTAQPLQ